MCARAVFSEGDAARPITASQPPGRARKTSKHYRARLARPLQLHDDCHSICVRARRPTPSRCRLSSGPSRGLAEIPPSLSAMARSHSLDRPPVLAVDCIDSPPQRYSMAMLRALLVAERTQPVAEWPDEIRFKLGGRVAQETNPGDFRGRLMRAPQAATQPHRRAAI